jgi:hypothetical protein
LYHSVNGGKSLTFRRRLWFDVLFIIGLKGPRVQGFKWE